MDFLAVEIFAEGLQSLGTQNSNLHVKSYHMMQNQLVSNLFRVHQLCPRLFTDHNFTLFIFFSAKVTVKVIQLESFVCVIYMPPSTCSGNIVLVIIFSPVSSDSDGLNFLPDNLCCSYCYGKKKASLDTFFGESADVSILKTSCRL